MNSFIDAKLRQGRSKNISYSCSGLFTSTEHRYQLFVINVILYKLIHTKLRVSVVNLLLDNSRTNR